MSVLVKDTGVEFDSVLTLITHVLEMTNGQ
jgi:hypothetical protein